MTAGASRERRPAALDVALLVAGSVVLTAVVLRAARIADAGTVATTDTLEAARTLSAVAGILAAVLARRRAPAIAWAAAGIAGILAVHEPVALASAVAATAPDAGGGGVENARDEVPWLGPAVVVATSAALATLVTALHAARPAPPPLPGAIVAAVVGLAWTVIACLVAVGLRAAGGEPDPAVTPLDVVQVPVGAWPLVPLVLLLLGLGADARGPYVRARRRATAEALEPTPRAVGRALLDELAGRSATRRDAEAAERERLAADLHADVMPGLRTVLADLEAGGDPAVAAARLRAITEDLEAAMLARHHVILDELGLVTALEWLAERTEDRGLGRVDLDVADEPADGRAEGRPPRPVERAVLRVAELAIANGAAHGDGHVAVRLACRRDRVMLEVTSRRPLPPDAGTGAAGRGRRGLVDMRRAAADVGADLELAATPDGGLRVLLRWEEGPAGQP